MILSRHSWKICRLSSIIAIMKSILRRRLSKLWSSVFLKTLRRMFLSSFASLNA